MQIDFTERGNPDERMAHAVQVLRETESTRQAATTEAMAMREERAR